jgi:1-pyrroline-5-carboxylate dehydrogenase
VKKPAPFRNEPMTDFSKPANAKAFRAALDRVEKSLGQRHPIVIGGERVTTEATIRSVNPTDPDQVVGEFSSGGVEVADRAVEAAAEAFPAWAATSWEDRASLLFRVAARLRKDKHFYSAWMVKEEAKTWPEADADTAEAIDFCEYYGREALRYGRGLPVVQTGDRNACFYIPLGVGAVISPWNFPLAILCGMTTAAIVSGNTVVIKPAGDSTTIAWWFFRLLEEEGCPPGVVNFCPGPGSTLGARLVQHPKVRFVAFTGSKETGLWISGEAGKVPQGQAWIKRAILEMGGKDAIVVDADTDLDVAAAGVAAAAFGFQGQKCSACSRAIVLDSVYEPFLAKLTEKVKAIRVGDPADAATQFGPVVSKSQYEKVLEYCDVARNEGTVVLGGKAVDGRKGWFVEPTVVRDVSPDARLAQEEVFGPVLAVIRAKDWDDAIQIANGTEFGLTGAVYSDDPEHLEDARRRFHVGNLYLNRKCTGALVGAQPFGGYNMSGTCSKAGGPDYLGLFLQQKSISTRPT